MARLVPRDILLLLQRIGGGLAHRPARDVALWLSVVPFVLPAPLVAGMIALSRRKSGDTDPRWGKVLALSSANVLLSLTLLIYGYHLLGELVLDRVNDLFDPFPLWQSGQGDTSVRV